MAISLVLSKACVSEGVLRLEKDKVDWLALQCRYFQKLEWQSVSVKQIYQVLSSVSCERVIISDSWLKLEKFNTWNHAAKISLLNCSHLRVLVAQRYKIPKSSHFYQLVVKLSLNFFDEDFKVLRNILDRTSVEKNKVEYFGSLSHIFFPLSLLTQHDWCLGNLHWQRCIRLSLVCLLRLGSQVF